MFRTRRVHLQGYCCTYNYGIVGFTCFCMSSLVGRRVCSIHTTQYSIYNLLPEDGHSYSKHVEDTKKN